MREIYGERRMEGVWGEVVPLPTEGPVWKPWGAMPLPGKECKLHAEKVKFGAHFVYFCYFNISTFKTSARSFSSSGSREIDTCFRETHGISGRLPGIPEDLGRC